MQHKPLNPHIRPRTQLQLQTNRLASSQTAFDGRLEVGADGARAVVGEELEDIAADSLGLLGGARFDGEEEVQDTSTDESNKIRGVVYDEVLAKLVSSSRRESP